MKAFNLRKLATAAGVALAFGVAAPAMATTAPTFTLAPSAFVPGLSDFTANQIAGTSSELLHITATGHQGSGWMQIGGFALNGNPLFANTTYLGTNYLLYLTYDLVDTYATGTPNTVNSTSNLTQLNFKFWLDRNMNNTYTNASAAGTGTEATVANRGDDELLAYGNLISGVAGFDSHGGAYLNSTQRFAVCTGAGSATLQGMPVAGALAAGVGDCTSGIGNQYFKLPQPFYGLAFDQFNNTQQGFDLNATAGVVAINQATGGIDFNRVPEPGSLALLGLGLLGVGVSARRRRAR